MVIPRREFVTGLIVAAIAGATLAASTAPGLAASQYAGTWKLIDTSGSAFQVTLGDAGAAGGNRNGKIMQGTWAERDGAAVITWSDGWTTKIAKDGDGYTKTVYDDGGNERNSSRAEKVR